MHIEISRALGTLQEMVNALFAMLPALGIALIVFGLFYYAANCLEHIIKKRVVTWYFTRAS